MFYDKIYSKLSWAEQLSNSLVKNTHLPWEGDVWKALMTLYGLLIFYSLPAQKGLRLNSTITSITIREQKLIM